MTILEELKQIEREATEGPWEFNGNDCHDGIEVSWDVILPSDGGFIQCMSGRMNDDEDGWQECQATKDAQFIAASRTMVPRLIRALEMCLNSSYDAALRSNIEHILSGIDDVCLGTDKDGE